MGAISVLHRVQKLKRDPNTRDDNALRKRILELFWVKGMGLRKIAKVLGDISHTTVWRIVNESEPPNNIRKMLKRYGPLLGEA